MLAVIFLHIVLKPIEILLAENGHKLFKIIIDASDALCTINKIISRDIKYEVKVSEENKPVYHYIEYASQRQKFLIIVIEVFKNRMLNS